MKTKLIAQLDAKPEIKHGLAESKRQEIYRAIIFADSRAEADAQRMYPLPDPLKPGYSQAQAHEQILRKRDAKETLVEKYEMAVAKRYRIKEATIHDIAVEGFTKNWPIPPK